jgi:peptide/nickel transport system permease protein
VRKLLFYGLTLFMVCSLNFGLIHLMPGDPLVHLLGEEGYAQLTRAPNAALEALRDQWGLDESLAAQFGGYLGRIASGNWGWSYHHGRPVSQLIGQHLRWTLWLLVPAILVSALAGGFLGALSAWHSRLGKHAWPTYLFLCLYAVPAYCIGLLILIPASRLEWLPVTFMADAGAGFWEQSACLVLPFTVLAIHGTAYKFIVMRNAVREELGSPYVLTALSKGLSLPRLLFGHVVVNALPPFLSLVALNVGFMVGGTLLVEVVFSWQGMGTLIYQAVVSRDYPVLSGALTALAFSVLAANAAADMLNGIIDPRIREGGGFGRP